VRQREKKYNDDRSFAFFPPLSPPHFWLIIKKRGFFFLPPSRSFLHSYRVRQHTKKKRNNFAIDE